MVLYSPLTHRVGIFFENNWSKIWNCHLFSLPLWHKTKRVWAGKINKLFLKNNWSKIWKIKKLVLSLHQLKTIYAVAYTN